MTSSFIIRRTVLSSLAAGYLCIANAQDTVQIEKIQITADTEKSYSATSASVGTRTDTSIVEIPQSIITVKKEVIEDQGSKTLSDALRNVSNVNSVDKRDSNIVGFKIRGFNSATVIDGIAMPGYFPNQESLVNVERIDVVKGPSGALFGSSQGAGTYGTLGGTVAITTSEPEAVATQKLGMKFGSYGEKGGSFDINQPINNELAVRLVGEISDSDSETDNVYFKKKALFPSFSWRPSGQTSVVLRLRYLDDETLDYSGLPIKGTLDTSTHTLARSTNITANGLPATTTTSKGANLQVDQVIVKDWKFNLVAGYNEIEVDERGVYATTSADFFGMSYGSADISANLFGVRLWDKWKTTTLSPSVTGKFMTGSIEHTLMGGIDYEKTKDDAFMVVSDPLGYMISPLNGFTPVNLTNPTYPNWVEPVAPSTPTQQNTYRSSVVYLQDQMDIGNLHLLGSVRHSRINIDDANTDPLFGGTSNHTTNTSTTPRVGATYEFTPEFSIFSGYSEGIKVPTGSKFTTPPKPEESEQKEIGLRLSKFAGISATLAWFDLKRKNAAVADSAHPGYSIQTGIQQSKGVDLDVLWEVNPSWKWIGAFTTQTAKITEDTTTSRVGKQLFNVPEKSARIATRYDVMGGTLDGLGMGLGMTYRSELPVNTTNTAFTPSASVWDAQLSYKMAHARYGININNLLGKEYYIPSAYFGGGQVTPASPRTVMATAMFTF
ncbi:MAG: TonB-dependent receptor [Sulfuricurvum sp.]|uniref:TonB-dependent siderophore receptor n=1 Tax=Sulfuricurvum sp. TaxID=2025608 RepID=UPI002602DFFF|nr:TonB-dependent receptor [Sulfuricurvum sp.]MDD2828101.1 TonB-dependent receptor [Sulfuricurvum sp.]MDD4948025.1 TonB-dependent receptor [Sulfuricurvum sp.]